MTVTREETIKRLKQNKAAAEFYASQSRITAEIENALKDSEAFDMAIEALQDRPKGEWKCMADCGVTECDQCGWNVEEYVGDYNYCPHCGARMKGGEDE